jgi:predicted transposase YdaD
MIDNICKFLAENFSADFASWILGKSITLTKLETSELSTEPIRADSVIFLESSALILHIEFQTEPNQNIPFRMADYRLRLYRRFPKKEVYQVVIYLTPSQSPLVYENTFNLRELNHQTDSPAETLRQVARKIENITDKQVQSNVAASTAIISGIALSKEIIQRLLRSEIMKESVIYQEILLEGKAEGLAEGKTKEREKIAMNMISSNISVDLVAQFTGLTPKQVQKLQLLQTKKPQSPSTSKVKRSSKKLKK